MTLHALCAVAALTATCLAATASAFAAERQPQRLKPLAAQTGSAEGRVIVKFKADAGAVRAHALSAGGDRAVASAALERRAQTLGLRRGLALTSGRGISERSQVVRASGIDSATLARVLAADPEVEYAEPDLRRRRAAVPNDPLFLPVAGSSPASGQWYLKAPSVATPAAINAVTAWDTTVGSTSMVVAVLDTGVRYDHPDLAGKLLPGRDMVRVEISNDGDGRDSDASDPGDWISAADLSNPTYDGCEESDSSWHGTIVSGLVGAASNNSVGMAGVSWNAKVLPVRVLGKCFGYDSDIVAGMRWAAGLTVPGEPVNPVGNRARVINLSLGGEGACTSTYSTAVNEVIAAGAVVVAAAGNSNGHAVETPGNCPGVIAVAGLRHAGSKVGYSDLGPEVTIAAPAGNCVNTTGICIYPILSTTNGGTTTPVAGDAGATYTDAFNISVGTSFSAPLVAGTVALMLSANPSLTASQVKSLLQSSARPFPTTGGTAGIPMCQAPTATDQDECYCTTSTCGAGMLDANAAVLAASGLQAAFSITPASPTAGDSVTLNAASTQAGTGRTVASYAWSLVSGSNIASFTGATDASTATLATTAAGSVTVRLTVTDDVGNSSTLDQQITVAAVANTNNGSSGGGGGGGVLSLGWLLALATALAATRRGRRR